MTLRIQWYGRHPDFTPNYDEAHHGTISGNNAAECMKKYNDWRMNQDISRYTPSEIICVYD